MKIQNHLPSILLLMRPERSDAHSIEEIYSNLHNYYFKQYGGINIYTIKKEKSIFQNVRDILTYKANIIHITGDITYAAIFLSFFSKVVITQHDIGHYKNLHGFKKWIYKLFWLQLPMWMCKKIITVSSATKEDLIHMLGIAKDKIVVIYNPIPESPINQAPKKLNRPPVILQVGTGKNKNLETIIRAIKGLEVKLMIIGSLSKNQLQLLIENQIDYENCSNLPYTEVLNHYYLSDIVTFVSTHEGFGMPVIEANMMGTPIITSSLAVIKEIAGEAALFVEDAFSLDEIKTKIITLLDDIELRHDLVNKGYKNILRFTGKEISQQYLNVYKNL